MSLHWYNSRKKVLTMFRGRSYGEEARKKLYASLKVFISQLWRWYTVFLDTVLTTLRKNQVNNHLAFSLTFQKALWVFNSMFRKIMDFTEKQKNRKNHIQNGMFKLSWRGNVSYTNTTLAFERDLSNIFFWVKSQIVLDMNVLFLSKSVGNLNCEL